MSTPNPTDPTVTPARPGEAASFPSVVLEVLREMREQRQSFERSAELAAKERKAERRWRNLFQAMFFGAPVLLGLLYFLFFLNSTGFRWGPFGNVVGVVRIEGPIGATERASAENIIPILEKAFGNPNVKGPFARNPIFSAASTRPWMFVPRLSVPASCLILETGILTLK